MTKNGALVLDHLLHIRAALDEIRSDMREVMATVASIENRFTESTRPGLRAVTDAQRLGEP